MENHLPQLWTTLRNFVPPTQALFLAAAAGIILGGAVPVSYLQQAAGPLSQLSSSVMSGR
jgi:hypothetical protein